jgi:GLPGLI family protein
MRKLIALLIITTTLFTACDSLKSGAGKISEGKISYKIDLSDSEMGMLEKQLLQMAKLNISFKDALMKTEFDMGMMGTTIVVDGNTKSGLMLFNAMGNKTAARMTAEDLLKKEKAKGAYTVEYSDETKEIAGYKCKKATLKMENGANFTLFYSEDIQPAKMNTDFTFSEIKGFPLEMQIDMQGMKFNMVASSVDGTPLSADNFSMAIPEGYSETTMAQFGGMMGGGAN